MGLGFEDVWVFAEGGGEDDWEDEGCGEDCEDEGGIEFDAEHFSAEGDEGEGHSDGSAAIHCPAD